MEGRRTGTEGGRGDGRQAEKEGTERQGSRGVGKKDRVRKVGEAPIENWRRGNEGR